MSLVRDLIESLVVPIPEGAGIMDYSVMPAYKEERTIVKKAYEKPTAKELTLGQLVEYVDRKGFNVEFVGNEYDVADHGQWGAALYGNKIKVAKKVGDYNLTEADMIAAIAHELGHDGDQPSERTAQAYAERFLSKDFPHYEGLRAAQQATERLSRSGMLN